MVRRKTLDDLYLAPKVRRVQQAPRARRRLLRNTCFFCLGVGIGVQLFEPSTMLLKFAETQSTCVIAQHEMTKNRMCVSCLNWQMKIGVHWNVQLLILITSISSQLNFNCLFKFVFGRHGHCYVFLSSDWQPTFASGVGCCDHWSDVNRHSGHWSGLVATGRMLAFTVAICRRFAATVAMGWML